MTPRGTRIDSLGVGDRPERSSYLDDIDSDDLLKIRGRFMATLIGTSPLGAAFAVRMEFAPDDNPDVDARILTRLSSEDAVYQVPVGGGFILEDVAAKLLTHD